MEHLERIERLLETPCQIFDYLPERVPASRGKTFFELESILLSDGEKRRLSEKCARIVLKLLCYFDFAAYRESGEAWVPLPLRGLEPAVRQAYETGRGCVNILLTKENALIAVSDQTLAVYHSGGRMRELCERLAMSEGLFFRPGAN